VLSLQDCVPVHLPGPVQEAVASAAVRHTPSFAHEPMRLSMVRQYASPWAEVHVYLQ
jgi:hypothetical protein